MTAATLTPSAVYTPGTCAACTTGCPACAERQARATDWDRMRWDLTEATRGLTLIRTRRLTTLPILGLYYAGWILVFGSITIIVAMAALYLLAAPLLPAGRAPGRHSRRAHARKQWSRR